MPLRLFFGLCTLLSIPTFVSAQLPNPALDFVFPTGGQVGTELVVTVGGRDLDEARRLVFSHPGITGTVVLREPAEFESEPQPVPDQFRVTIPLNVPPGLYDVRVVGRFGVSTPRTFVVSDVPQQVEPPDHQSPDKASELPLDVDLHGRTDAGAVDYYRFSARKDQTLIVECSAPQIDSNLVPVITIWDAKHDQLARSKHLLDNVLEFVAPADGEYILGINDHVFAGGTGHHYRLRIHSGPYLMSVSPALARPGQSATFTVHGLNLPDSQADEQLRWQGVPLRQRQVSLFVPTVEEEAPAPNVVEPVSATPNGFVFRWPSPQGESNGLLIAYAQHPVVTEAESNDTPDTAQSVPIPCEYSGRFYPRRDQDWVQFEARQGQAYQVRVISHRLGHPTDPEVFLQKVVKAADGQTQVSQVSTEDDFKLDGNRFKLAIRRGLELAHRDPVVRFTADQDGVYRIGLRDLNGGSVDDPRFDYRLVVEPQQPDFQLLAWTQQLATDDDKKIDRASVVLRPAATLPLLIDVLRQGGFDGEVCVTAKNLPPGVTAEPCCIGPGTNEGILLLTAAADAADHCGPIEVVGQAKIEGQQQQRVANEAVLTGATANVEQTRPTARLARRMMLAVAGQESAPVEVRVGGEQAETAPWQTSIGANLDIPLAYIKHSEAKEDLGLAAIGLPDKVKAEGLTLKPDANDGQLQLKLDSGEIKPGKYSVFLRGKLKAMYARNPQAIEAVKARRSQFDAVIAALDEQVQQAGQKLTEAQQSASQQTAEIAQLEAAEKSIRESLDLAAQQIKQANDPLTALQQAAASTAPERAATIQKLVQRMQTATTEATAQMQTAQAAAQEVTAQLDQVRSQIQSAQSAVAAAEAEQKQLQERRQRADAYVKQLDQQLADAEKNWGPKEVVSYVNTRPIQLEILNSPVEVNMPSEPLQLKRGESHSLEVHIARRFGFDDSVNITLQAPEGVAEVTAEPGTIDKEHEQSTLQVVVGPNAPTGQHTVQIKPQLKFNGVDIQDSVPLQIVVLE